jgi:hypothetical protein
MRGQSLDELGKTPRNAFLGHIYGEMMNKERDRLSS